MQVLTTRQPWWAAQCEAVLAAEGVPAFWEPHPLRPSFLVLEVSEPFVAQAVELLSAQLGEDIERSVLAAQSAQYHVQAPLLLRPAVATGLGMATLQIVAFAVMGGEGDRSNWFARGSLARAAVLQGELWRLVTAATLHADVPHVLGNATFFILLMWAAGERLGSGAALGTWLATAIGGFVASLALSDIGFTVGASGGLFGLLGAASGHALRWRVRRGTLASRRFLEIFGAAALLLAFTAFSREANVYAHVGGFVAGLGIGLCAARRPLKTLPQVGLALATAAIIAAAWACAMLPVF